MNVKACLFGLGFCCLASFGFSDVNAKQAQTQVLPKTLSIPGGPVYKLKAIVCPKPSELVKDSKTTRWSALGTWKGANRSLATKVTTFLGGQWQGINLGQPFCVYEGAPAGTFQIILAYHTFSITPRAGHWQGNAHQNLFKCFSHNRLDCRFQVRLKPKELTVNQKLDQIKSGSHSDDLSNQGF
jgi:hypothetical protein